MLEKKLKKIFIFITIQKNANANQRNFFSKIIIKPICKPELFEKKISTLPVLRPNFFKGKPRLDYFLNKH